MARPRSFFSLIRRSFAARGGFPSTFWFVGGADADEWGKAFANGRLAERHSFADGEGDVIVAADGAALERPLVGLTLLEAAAVPGETLAADALDAPDDETALAFGGVELHVPVKRKGSRKR